MTRPESRFRVADVTPAQIRELGAEAGAQQRGTSEIGVFKAFQECLTNMSQHINTSPEAQGYSEIKIKLATH